MAEGDGAGDEREVELGREEGAVEWVIRCAYLAAQTGGLTRIGGDPAVLETELVGPKGGFNAASLRGTNLIKSSKMINKNYRARRTFHVQKNQSPSASMLAMMNSCRPCFIVAL